MPEPSLPCGKENRTMANAYISEITEIRERRGEYLLSEPDGGHVFTKYLVQLRDMSPPTFHADCRVLVKAKFEMVGELGFKYPDYFVVWWFDECPAVTLDVRAPLNNEPKPQVLGEGYKPVLDGEFPFSTMNDIDQHDWSNSRMWPDNRPDAPTD